MRYPVALHASGTGGARVEYRVGKYRAGAEADAVFVAFGAAIQRAAEGALRSPVRLLPLPHCRNAIVQSLRGLPRSSIVLVDGFIWEAISQNRLLRIMTVSRDLKPYQALYAAADEEVVRAGVIALRGGLQEASVLGADEARALLPHELQMWNRNAAILLGHLLYLGWATCDVPPGIGVDEVRLPYAQARF
jgi:hypothetical protein